MSKKAGKTKSKWCECKGVNKDTCKMKTGYKPKKGGGCPVKAKGSTSTLTAKKTSAPKTARAKKAKLHADIFHVPGLTKTQSAKLHADVFHVPGLTPAQKVALAYHSGHRAHTTGRDTYFDKARNARNAAAMKKAIAKLKKNPNAGAVATAHMADLFPGMSGLRGLRGHRRTKRAKARRRSR